jgi:hypothetical protein
MTTKTAELAAQLESMVDSDGLVAVLIALELMCDDKAIWVESVESIGQPDKVLARLWRKAGKACRKAADVATLLP